MIGVSLQSISATALFKPVCSYRGKKSEGKPGI